MLPNDLSRHDWGDSPFTLALVFVLLILVRIAFHWFWIKTCTKSILFPPRQVPCNRCDDTDTK